MAKVPDSTCSIERTLGVLGERWTFLILREALTGSTRFSEFRDALGVATDVLLSGLCCVNISSARQWRHWGSRRRERLPP